MFSTIAASIYRHSSEDWARMSDVTLNYDLMFVGAFGLFALAASIGLLKKKKWGYAFAMAFNYILALMAFLPICALLIFNLQNDIPLSEIAKLKWYGNNLDNLFISAVSIILIVFMSRSNVKTLYKNM